MIQTATIRTWAGWATSERNEGKPQRSVGSNASCCTLAGAAHTKCLSISLFGKLQSSSKLIRSTDPDVETDNLQLKLWLAHVCLTTIYILSFFFTFVLVLLWAAKIRDKLKKDQWGSIHWKCWLKTLKLCASLFRAWTMMLFITSIVSSNWNW